MAPAAWSGLSDEAAAAALAESGPNELHPKKQRSFLLALLVRFANPLVLVLLVSSGISAALGDVRSFVVIALIVLSSIVIDFVQEHRAERAAEALRQSVSTRARVRRSGREREIPAREIVKGDVVLISAGDLVPADARVLEARDLFVNQALLTGEAYPTEKHAAADESAGVPSELEPAAPDYVFMGSSVISGSATIRVVRTGSATSVGETVRLVTSKPPATDFERGTREFGLLITRFTAGLVLFVVLVNLVLRRPVLESFLFAVALAVGLTPELLPMIVSVTLARGAMRMAERRVIVKRMSAVQNLGAMDLLCTDKTGTLTEAKIQLERHVDALGRDSARVLELAYLNSVFESGLKSPLDDAILAHSGDVDASGYEKIDEVPFDFERRRVSVLVDDGKRRLLVVKGALEDVLALSSELETDGEIRPLDDAARLGAQQASDALGREGFRVLGIAWREVARDHPHAVVTDETSLVFAGSCAFLDPPKASAKSALARLCERGVDVKVVTGDSELVTEHVCRELGLEVKGVLTGAELRELDEDALRVRAERTTAFCRVTPAQKTRVLLALKSRGHVVGYMGDGINDAPSLHTADVGISVDSAVDVAKEAADLILLEHDLGVLYEGVLEGRRTFGNVMKYVMMGTSSNFGNMFSMAGAAAFLPFLPMLPLQILLNNLLYDISEIAIPLDRVDEDTLQKPHRWDVGMIRRFMLMIGPVSSVFDFVTFWLMLRVLHAGEALFHTGWFIESLASQILVIFVIRTAKNPLSSRPAPALAALAIGMTALAILLPFTALGATLGFVPPPLGYFAVLAILLVGYLASVEAIKRLYYRAYSR